jgi:hypothetical protein
LTLGSTLQPHEISLKTNGVQYENYPIEIRAILYAPLSVLGSQIFSGFWIGWIIENPTKSDSKSSKNLDVRSTLNVKNPKS